ncbi:ATP-binding protein (plasmid) [Tistrella mobilis]|uniref:AAA family ATPase n=1 Tax=Tistrella mobilis TaxID=171437 RepID=UPI0035569C8D
MSVNAASIAPLGNVGLFMDLTDRLHNRAPHLPGIGVFSGFSGYGKTTSAVAAANKFKARYVEVGQSWTQARFLRSLLVELGGQPKGTIGDMVDAAISHLARARVPVIIDEADHILARRYIELIRELHDKSGCTIILIGEEMLPQRIAAHERVHNRVLSWLQAQPADTDDVAALVKLYAPAVQIAPDLCALISERAGGRLRRVCVSIERVREWAATQGLKAVSLKEWGDRELYEGMPAVRRAV